MAAVISRKRSRGKKSQKALSPPSEPELEHSAPEDDDVDMEKDEAEEELERLVFGDSAGFRDNIKSFAQAEKLAFGRGKVEGADLQEDEEDGLENVDDADLFFLDSGPTDANGKALVPDADASSEDEDFTRGARDPPAWEDSDDERLMVSLASVPRLRKLRRTEDEDVVNGREYTKRLRRQFERLYPVPEWANYSARKRRRGEDDGASDVSSSDGMEVDGDLSAQPLAKLLRDADSLTQRPENGVSTKRRKLRPEVLDIQRTKDIPGTQPSAVTSLSIHPTLPLLLSSGPSATLYLHHLHPHPPNPNPLLTSLHIKQTPLTTTAFHPSPSDPRIFLSARRRYFHIWDLASGRIEKVSRVYGHQHEQRSMERFKLSPTGAFLALLGSARKGGGVVNILNAKTLQWVAQARVESRGGIADLAWWSDGRGLCIAGKNGEVSEWSVDEGRTVARWIDEGAVGTTVIALGGTGGLDALGVDRWVVVGSSSGVVNIYDRRGWAQSSQTTQKHTGGAHNMGVPANPKPTRAFDQLTTPTSHLAFSPDGQVLCFASRWKKDALRLAHLPSCTVYRNWPTGGTPLGRISSVAWGELKGGEMVLVVGNEQGKIRVWEVRG